MTKKSSKILLADFFFVVSVVLYAVDILKILKESVKI